MVHSNWQKAALWAARCAAIHPLLTRGVPPKVALAALEANPWFTPYYLDEALRNILDWFDPEKVSRFFDQYPDQEVQEKKVAVITAGNVPLVGLHDVLMVLWSGHIALIKASHQDEVMLRWLLEAWAEKAPGLESRFFFTEELGTADAVIATGSNNTARYFRESFVHMPALIRNNRYSVAILDATWSDSSLDALASDMLMYNGLGCRNVSNLVVAGDFEISRIQQAIGRYPLQHLNPLYVRKLAVEKAKGRVLGISFQETPALLLAGNNIPAYAQMGWGWWIEVEDLDVANRLAGAYRDQIQCVVSKDLPLGNTQHPGLSDFADDRDTMKWLRSQI